ncbi:hypothetical protein MKK64_05245 [Methylobacterium sp. E-025]|jgi:hypothetical protein|uniref:hypothetical protein n=1 Tax=unclassified Methylobacterium TaxID=2615210 RepID=UPI001FBBF532|nr:MULTISPECIES: hypothetical protein [unclassified Methylobacterium]MCJ2039881.1 hypothetical protein [Methylobacterium sp. J-059]MCJ2110610.1 hypothetical protein [Methylobacterium sp. E-025]
MSTKSITEQALSYIAGEVAASGRRPAIEVAQRIMERLEKEGINVIRTTQTDELQAPITVRIDQTDSPTLAQSFDASVVRDAYRLGYERGTYENGGDPSTLDLEGSAYRWGQAHDLAVHLGDGGVQASLHAFIGTEPPQPAATEGEDYVLTPEGEDVIRDLIEHTALTQAAVTAAGDALEERVDADPDRYVRSISGRDHAVDPMALAVSDLIEANRLIAMAVATLGHEAADLIMQNLLTPGANAAAA